MIALENVPKFTWPALLLLLLVAFQLASMNSCCEVSNLLIPDGIGYLETIREFRSGQLDILDVPAGWAVILAYAEAYWLGIPGILLLNFGLFLIARRALGPRTLTIGAVTAGVFRLAERRKFHQALLLCVVRCFVRDGSLFMPILIQPRYQLPAAMVVLALAWWHYGINRLLARFAATATVSRLGALAYLSSGTPFPPGSKCSCSTYSGTSYERPAQRDTMRVDTRASCLPFSLGRVAA